MAGRVAAIERARACPPRRRRRRRLARAEALHGALAAGTACRGHSAQGRARAAPALALAARSARIGGIIGAGARPACEVGRFGGFGASGLSCYSGPYGRNRRGCASAVEAAVDSAWVD